MRSNKDLEARLRADSMVIGGRLRAYRHASGMTLEAVAEALGLSYQTVHNREAGRNRIPAGELPLYAEIFGCKAKDFLP